jgi:hypothetical protein
MGKRRDTHNFVLGMAAGQQAKSNNSSQRPKMHFPLNLWSIFFKKAERYLSGFKLTVGGSHIFIL